MRLDGFPIRTNSSEIAGKIAEIETICEMQRSIITDFVDKTKGPKVDHKSSGVKVAFTTYSNRYVGLVLECEVVARVYALYVQLVFEGFCCEELVKYWKIGCCEGKHSSECTQKWSTLKDLFLQEIEVYKNHSFVFTQVDGLLAA